MSNRVILPNGITFSSIDDPRIYAAHVSNELGRFSGTNPGYAFRNIPNGITIVEVKRHLKDAPQRIRALNEQGALCNTQLANLIGAIRNGAEVDANGVAMDEVYFQRQAQNELNAVAKWLAFVADTRRLIDAGMVLEAATRAPMDSLLQAKRAEWAQQIAAE